MDSVEVIQADIDLYIRLLGLADENRKNRAEGEPIADARQLIARHRIAAKQAIVAKLTKWLEPAHMQLHAGEMTAQERRTVKAVVAAIIAEVNRT